MEMTECLQNGRFYRTIISNNSSEVKSKLLKNYRYQKTFLLLTYIEKTSYFEVAPPGHTVGYKNVDYLSKNHKYIL